MSFGASFKDVLMYASLGPAPEAEEAPKGPTGILVLRGADWSAEATHPIAAPVTLSHIFSVMLVVLPAPLTLRHGPLAVTIERYSDGKVFASVPALRLYGSAESDADALDALGEAILEFYEDVAPLAKTGNIGGLLRRQWIAFEALVEVKE